MTNELFDKRLIEGSREYSPPYTTAAPKDNEAVVVPRSDLLLLAVVVAVEAEGGEVARPIERIELNRIEKKKRHS
jgi:hypothetical protein